MAADPVVLLVVLLQGAMPTAQNLVVLLHLDGKARTRSCGPATLVVFFALLVVSDAFLLQILHLKAPPVSDTYQVAKCLATCIDRDMFW